MRDSRYWTTAEVRALMREDRAWPRYELIDGELLVTPGPAVPHQLATGEFYLRLVAYLRQCRVGLVMLSPSDLELREGTITQPDVFVIPATTTLAGDRLEWPDVRGLLLAIEVLSPSSIRADRVLKRDFYLRNGVLEYWIVDVDARTVERHRADTSAVEVVRGAITWAPSGVPPLVIDLDALFDTVAAQATHVTQ